MATTPAVSGFIRVEIGDGETIVKVARSLATWFLNIEDLSPAWTLVGERLLEDNARNFALEGALYPRSLQSLENRFASIKIKDWPALAPSTIRDRLRKGFGPGPIEVRTGELKASLTARNASGNVFIVGKNSLQVGSDLAKAEWQHFGTEGRGALMNIPPRPLVGLTRDTQQFMVRTLGDYVRNLAARAQLETTPGSGDGGEIGEEL